MKHANLAALMVTGMVLLSASARAVEGPPLNPGLWETRYQVSPRPKGAPAGPAVSQRCLDAKALDHGKRAAAEFEKTCSKNETVRAGNRWTSDLVCKVGGSTTTTHSVTDVANDGSYHTEMSITTDSPSAGQSHTTTTVDGKRLGACKPQ